MEGLDADSVIGTSCIYLTACPAPWACCKHSGRRNQAERSCSVSWGLWSHPSAPSLWGSMGSQGGEGEDHDITAKTFQCQVVDKWAKHLKGHIRFYFSYLDLDNKKKTTDREGSSRKWAASPTRSVWRWGTRPGVSIRLRDRQGTESHCEPAAAPGPRYPAEEGTAEKSRWVSCVASETTRSWCEEESVFHVRNTNIEEGLLLFWIWTLGRKVVNSHTECSNICDHDQLCLNPCSGL